MAITLKQRLIDLTDGLVLKLNELYLTKEEILNKKQDLQSTQAKHYPSVPAVNAGITASYNASITYVNQLIADLVEPIPLVQKGTALGVAETDENNIILPKHLPGSIEEIINLKEFVTANPVSGMVVGEIRYNSVTKKIITSTSATEVTEANPIGTVIYVNTSDNKPYRWSGLEMVFLGGPSLVLGETSTTAFEGAKGKVAYLHTFDFDNPHNVTKAQVGLPFADNTPDTTKPVSGPQQAALDLKEDYLGLPATNGRILSSSIGGSREWIVLPAGITSFDALTDRETAQIPTINLPLKAALLDKASVASVTAIQTYLNTYINEDNNTEFPNYALQLTEGVQF